MAYLFTPSNRKWKWITNLGWLRRNWQSVEYFRCHTYHPSHQRLDDGVMLAICRDGRVYKCEWQSMETCRDWIHRPIFRGIRTIWNGQEIKA